MMVGRRSRISRRQTRVVPWKAVPAFGIRDL
jgi:hypothetical protein